MKYKNVSVAGIGITPFGSHQDSSLLDLAATSVRDALDMASLSLKDVEVVFAGNATGPVGSITAVAEGLGISGIPVTRIEQACASGSTALRLACEAVNSGAVNTALAFGVEKMAGGVLQLDPQPTYESRLGLDMFPLLYALKSHQYLDFAGADAKDLASVAVKARRLGAMAKHAATAAPASIDEILASPMIADPVTRLQCCRNTDGAAALVVTSRPTPGAVRIVGGLAGISIDDPNKPMEKGWDARERIVETMARKLYEECAIGPDNIDLVQVNDAFTVAEPLYLEALGFARPGEGLALQTQGQTDITGRIPTNTDGGLIGRGHCLGATGLAMAYEICLQLLGRAGDRQVAKRAKTGLLQSHGYGGENLFVLTA
jgi:acetyl-CoA acetyltransferase